jgi:hypothetical protein
MATVGTQQALGDCKTSLQTLKKLCCAFYHNSTSPPALADSQKIIANFEAMFTSVSQVIVQSPPGRFWQVKKQHLPSWQSNSLGYKKNSP